VDYTYGFEFTASDEILTTSDRTRYQAANQFWLASPAPVIQVNGGTVSTGFTIDSTEGTVTFDAAQSFDDIVTASYSYPLPNEIAQGTALTASSLISERDLVGAGLGNLAEIQVEEVRLRREYRRLAEAASTKDIVPTSAKSVLGPYRFYALG
jgi:hypothetical protein